MTTWSVIQEKGLLTEAEVNSIRSFPGTTSMASAVWASERFFSDCFGNFCLAEKGLLGLGSCPLPPNHHHPRENWGVYTVCGVYVLEVSSNQSVSFQKQIAVSSGILMPS